MVSNIKMGTKVESEHRGTYNFIKKVVAKTGKMPPAKAVFKSIAKEHNSENKRYYPKLKRCKL